MMLKECAVCGNQYDKPLEIRHNGKSDFFDCFECAIHALAPKCQACDLKVIGHGVEVGDTIFCCAHCARKHGNAGLSDRIPNHVAYADTEF